MFARLMNALGYDRYFAQGGDWGAIIAARMAADFPEQVSALHVNLIYGRPADSSAPLAGLDDLEKSNVERTVWFNTKESAYQRIQETKPQTLAYGLTDSPAGLAGFMLVHGGFQNWSYGNDPTQSPTRDEVLDDLSLYWLTNTAVSAARLYWENRDENLISAAAQKTSEITIPVAISVFPDDDLYRAPETWARRAFPTLVYFHEAEAGGHFAAWEQPQIFSDEVRAAFRSLR